MTEPLAVEPEPREPENPAAWALALHIADHPMSTIQAAFRYLNAPLTLELHEAPADRAVPRDHWAALTPVERRMLDYALEHAQERIWSEGEFTVEEQAAVKSLRRMVAEARQDGAAVEPEWARPETEEEKLTKAVRMARAMSAPPITPSEWATTTEWPGRHIRAGDRRVHATAPFVINGVRRFWTACEKRVEAGYPMPHMPVDCRDCKRAIAVAEREDEVNRG